MTNEQLLVAAKNALRQNARCLRECFDDVMLHGLEQTQANVRDFCSAQCPPAKFTMRDAKKEHQVNLLLEKRHKDVLNKEHAVKTGSVAYAKGEKMWYVDRAWLRDFGQCYATHGLGKPPLSEELLTETCIQVVGRVRAGEGVGGSDAGEPHDKREGDEVESTLVSQDSTPVNTTPEIDHILGLINSRDRVEYPFTENVFTNADMLPPNEPHGWKIQQEDGTWVDASPEQVALIDRMPFRPRAKKHKKGKR